MGSYRLLNTNLLDTIWNTSSNEEKQSNVLGLISNGASANARCIELGFTALHLAAYLGDSHTFSLLLKYGANARARDNDGWEPIHTAAWAGRLKILEMIKDRDAINSGVLERSFLGFSTGISSNIDLNTQDDCGRMPRHHSFYSTFCEAQRNCPLKNGTTPLHLACARGHASCVDYLIQQGADVKTIDHSGLTPIDVTGYILEEISVSNSFLNICKKLLAEGATISKHGDRVVKTTTTLHSAVSLDDVEAVKFLMEKGACTVIPNTEGNTALHLAVQEGKYEILKEMLSWPKNGGADEHVLNGKEICMGSCRKEQRLPVTNGDGETVLHLATSKGEVEMMRLILSMTPTRELLEAVDLKSRTALHLAAYTGNRESVDLLLSYGADLSAKTEIPGQWTNETALDLIMHYIPQPIDLIEEALERSITLNDHQETKINYKILFTRSDNGSPLQLKVLTALFNSCTLEEIQKIVNHPVIETFLFLKWERFKFIFYIIMVPYLITTVLLITVSYLTYVDKELFEGIFGYSFLTWCEWGLLLSTSITLVLVIIDLIAQQGLDLEACIKIGSITMTFIAVLVDPTNHPWTKCVAAVSVLLNCFVLMFMLARLPTWGWGTCYQMYFTVALNFSKVLGAFAILYVAFTFSFLVLFEGEGPFDNVLKSFIKALVMTNELDYEGNFDNVDSATSWVGRFLFILFSFMISIIMMNLLTAIAVSDVSILKEQGEVKRFEKQTEVLYSWETFIYSNALKWLALPKLFKFFHINFEVREEISVTRALKQQLKTESLLEKSWKKVLTWFYHTGHNFPADIMGKIAKCVDNKKRNENAKASSPSASDVLYNRTVDPQSFLTRIQDQLTKANSDNEAMKTNLNLILEAIRSPEFQSKR